VNGQPSKPGQEPVRRVAVAGGGLAGITAALRLAQRGYKVTLFEEKDVLGGNIASRNVGHGNVIDVYPHMFQSWYRNFWKLMEDVGVDSKARKKSFTPFSSFYQLREKEFPKSTKLTDPYSAKHMLENLSSGVAPAADMFVFGYASLDLLAELLNPTVLLENMSLTGFLGSRPYMTEAAIKLYETYITRVWAIPGYLASAEDCRDYLTYCFAEPEEPSWLTTGSAAETIIQPLRKGLDDVKVDIRLNTRVKEVKCSKGKVQSIEVESTRLDEGGYAWADSGGRKTEAVDDLVLAVPSTTLADLVRSAAPGKPQHPAGPDRASGLQAETGGYTAGSCWPVRLQTEPGIHRHLPGLDENQAVRRAHGARRVLLRTLRARRRRAPGRRPRDHRGAVEVPQVHSGEEVGERASHRLGHDVVPPQRRRTAVAQLDRH
jgi:phytoene dehydrogenase-like protein